MVVPEKNRIFVTRVRDAHVTIPDAHEMQVKQSKKSIKKHHIEREI